MWQAPRDAKPAQRIGFDGAVYLPYVLATLPLLLPPTLILERICGAGGLGRQAYLLGGAGVAGPARTLCRKLGERIAEEARQHRGAEEHQPDGKPTLTIDVVDPACLVPNGHRLRDLRRGAPIPSASDHKSRHDADPERGVHECDGVPAEPLAMDEEQDADGEDGDPTGTARHERNGATHGG
jgi:hypothetical protein